MPQQLLHFVYGLTDPRFDGAIAIRYIGITVDPNGRYKAHLSCPSYDPIEKNIWVQDVYAAGLEPGITIFEIYKASKGDRAQAEERETKWIESYARLGANLLNHKKMPSGHLDDLTLSEMLSHGLDLDLDAWLNHYNPDPGGFGIGTSE